MLVHQRVSNISRTSWKMAKNVQIQKAPSARWVSVWRTPPGPPRTVSAHHLLRGHQAWPEMTNMACKKNGAVHDQPGPTGFRMDFRGFHKKSSENIQNHQLFHKNVFHITSKILSKIGFHQVLKSSGISNSIEAAACDLCFHQHLDLLDGGHQGGVFLPKHF